MGESIMSNDPANDRYNPPSNLSDDFNEYKFDDILEHDLFWLNTNRTNNQVYRKINESQAMNLKTRETISFGKIETVFQKI